MNSAQRCSGGGANASTRRSTSQTSAHASSRLHDARPYYPQTRQAIGASTADSQLLHRWSRPRGGVDTVYSRTSSSRLSELVAYWSIDARRRRGSTHCSSVRTGGVRRMRRRCIMPTTVLGGHVGDASLSRLIRRPSGGTGRATTSRIGAVVNACKNRYTADSVQQASTTYRSLDTTCAAAYIHDGTARPSMLSSGGRRTGALERCWSELVETHITGGSCHGYCARYRA
jgi:hypothetical protein